MLQKNTCSIVYNVNKSVKLAWSLGFDLFSVRKVARARVRVGVGFRVRVRVCLTRVIRQMDSKAANSEPTSHNVNCILYFGANKPRNLVKIEVAP